MNDPDQMQQDLDAMDAPPAPAAAPQGNEGGQGAAVPAQTANEGGEGEGQQPSTPATQPVNQPAEQGAGAAEGGEGEGGDGGDGDGWGDEPQSPAAAEPTVAQLQAQLVQMQQMMQQFIQPQQQGYPQQLGYPQPFQPQLQPQQQWQPGVTPHPQQFQQQPQYPQQPPQGYPQQPPQVYLTQDEMNAVLQGDFTPFNTALARARSEAVQEATRFMAAMIPQQVKLYSDMSETWGTFMRRNKELAPYRDYVSVVASRVQSEHPDWDMKKVLQETERRSRQSLKMGPATSASPARGAAGGQRPALARPGGQQTPAPAPQVSALQAQLDEL